MTLMSRHWEVLNAIRDTLAADADLDGFNPKIQKKAYNRGMRWEPGLFVVPGSRTDPVFENRREEIGLQCVVVFIEPKDSDLTDGLENHLAVSERVMAIFKNKAHGYAPYPLRQLTTALAGDDAMTFQRVDAQQGPQFPDEPFNAGYDVSAVVVTVYVTYLPRDTSQLGVPAP
jgi:hypothetical protein